MVTCGGESNDQGHGNVTVTSWVKFLRKVIKVYFENTLWGINFVR